MELIKFNTDLSKRGDFSEVEKVVKDITSGQKNAQNLLYAIDALGTNEAWLESFQEAFQKEFKTNFGFRSLNEDEMAVQYDITQGSITPTIATTILPSLEKLVRSNELLSRINIVRVGENSFYKMFDFDAEQDAAILSEVASGSDVDEVLREGDTLIANQKVQASMKMSEFVLTSLDPAQIGKYLARLTRRVQQRLCVAVLANGSTAVNGTARGNNIRGILNNYGVNGTGDTTGTVGAISYATKAATDAAIVAAGGVASTDAYDLLYKAKAFLLPTNVSDVEEDDYIFVGNRNTWGQAKTVTDLNGRYKASSAVDPVTGKVVRKIDDTEFLIVPANQAPNSRVYLMPPKFYTLIIKGDILNLSDNGLVQLREGVTQFVSRTWASGSMEYAQKFRPGTAVTIGTTVPDNGEQNAFRVFNTV